MFYEAIKKKKKRTTGPERIKSKSMDENRGNKLTAMLRKSEKSVVLLLQQDHPWRRGQRH